MDDGGNVGFGNDGSEIFVDNKKQESGICHRRELFLAINDFAGKQFAKDHADRIAVAFFRIFISRKYFGSERIWSYDFHS